MNLFPTLLSLTIISTVQSKTLGFPCTHYYAAIFRNPLVGMGVGGRGKADPLEQRNHSYHNQDLFHLLIPYD